MTAVNNQPASAEPIAWENPLIPNKKLRALYVAMVEMRLLDEYLGETTRRRRALATTKGIRGEEGCRVSTKLDLKQGDLTSEASMGVATDFVRGTKLAELLHRANSPARSPANVVKSSPPGQLPAVRHVIQRMQIAIGAALALKASKRRSLVVAYVHSNEVSAVEWKPVLRFAAEQVVPILIVILPVDHGAKSRLKAGQLCLMSSKNGVPGIPVDAADPVALFRVAQESMLRVRAGGGPVLMECIPFHLPGERTEVGDPIATMRDFLVHRKIVDEVWLRNVDVRFTARLKAAQQQH